MTAARRNLEWSDGAAGPVLAAADTPRSWRDLALCAEVDGEIFFPEKGCSTWDGKRVCRACPVRTECLTFALGTEQRYGTWGGLSEPQRRRLLRRPGGITPSVIAAAIRRQDEKPCTSCRVTRPLEAFRRDTSHADGHATQCIECLSAQVAA